MKGARGMRVCKTTACDNTFSTHGPTQRLRRYCPVCEKSRKRPERIKPSGTGIFTGRSYLLAQAFGEIKR